MFYITMSFHAFILLVYFLPKPTEIPNRSTYIDKMSYTIQSIYFQLRLRTNSILCAYD